MKTKSIAASLLLAALPLSAQADPATDRALRLNQEPLSALTRQVDGDYDRQVVARDFDTAGDSAAMAEVRLKLRAYHQSPSHIAVSENAMQLAREATER
ncbi:hypothetical protein GCM10022228_06820 [Halomonas cibimaris]|uniref:Uncharacterized protein n=1 Tax=Halomonas cibimaris TaxID=657012 RepID=A0ABP7LHA9_9GAMM